MASIIEWADLDEAWPKGKTTMERYEIGRGHRECLDRIRELHELIAETGARTIAGAAVQLRRLAALFDRLGAILDRENRAAGQLLRSALRALEAHSKAA